MFCPKCGKQINDDVIFCAYCGEIIVPDDPGTMLASDPAAIIITLSVLLAAAIGGRT